MRDNPRKIVFSALGLIIFIGIIVFSYFRFGRYLEGPSITTINIESFMSVSEPSIIIDAEIENTQSALLNNRNLILNAGLSFQEIVVFSPGTNIIEVVLEDAFGKQKKYIYTIFYNAAEVRDIPLTKEQAEQIASETLEENSELIIN